jgi:hypothetical protein
MSSPRSYPNSVPRDPDTTSVMAAPGPPGPLMTDKHDGTVNDVPVALVSTNSTAHILEPINPSINPNNPANDAIVKDLVNYIDVDHHDDMKDATTTSSSASRRLHDLQPNQHSGHKAYNSFKQEDDGQLQNVINDVTNTFESCASIDYSAGIPIFKTVLDEATSSAKPSTPSTPLPDIHNLPQAILKHQIPKFQDMDFHMHELAVSA